MDEKNMDLKKEMLEAIFEYELSGLEVINKALFENSAEACANIAEKYALDIATEREVMITAFDKIRKQFEGRLVRNRNIRLGYLPAVINSNNLALK